MIIFVMMMIKSSMWFMHHPSNIIHANISSMMNDMMDDNDGWQWFPYCDDVFNDEYHMNY